MLLQELTELYDCSCHGSVDDVADLSLMSHILGHPMVGWLSVPEKRYSLHDWPLFRVSTLNTRERREWPRRPCCSMNLFFLRYCSFFPLGRLLPIYIDKTYPGVFLFFYSLSPYLRSVALIVANRDALI